MNQAELIAQLKQGEEAAFKKLVDEYEGMIYNTALGIVQSAEDADDVTQEVFVQVYQSISSFKGDSKLSTWLYRIAISKALDHEKKKKRKKRFGFVQSLFGNAGEEMLFRSLKQLPDKQRIAFTLHKLEGQSYQEVAEIMSTSLYAIESLMARAKTNLKKSLAKYYEVKNH